MVDSRRGSEFRGGDEGGDVADAGARGPGLVLADAGEGAGARAALGAAVLWGPGVAGCAEGCEEGVGHFDRYYVWGMSLADSITGVFVVVCDERW